MIGVYGGSFDPVHLGHLHVARHILSVSHLTRIFLTPANRHAFGKPLTAARHRFRMLELAVGNEPELAVSDLEAMRGGISYTIDLLPVLDEEHGRDNYCFITGMDNLNSFFQWKEWSRIVRNWNIVFTTRANTEPVPETICQLEHAAGRAVHRTDHLPEKPAGLILLTIPDWPISSSVIRKMLLNGDCPSDMMDAKVLDYINDQQLYRMER